MLSVDFGQNDALVIRQNAFGRCPQIEDGKVQPVGEVTRRLRERRKASDLDTEKR